MFVGRPEREKGIQVLMEAWRFSGLLAPTAALVLVGVGFSPPRIPADGAVDPKADGNGQRWDGVLCLDPVSPVELRNFYAACDVLVVPSIPTRTFREPWGLVVNEAMNRGLPVIASDAVGAAAGGLVRDGETGLVVPAGDSAALGAAIGRLASDPGLRARLGAAAAAEVRAFSHEAWAHGFSQALGSLGLSLGPLVACTHHP
jgi:glycosyltransferase involved in cell wall biosynthesis